MRHIYCAACGKEVHYSQAVHMRAHERTDVYKFRTQPMDYFDLCRPCYDRMRGGGSGGQKGFKCLYRRL